MIIFKEVNGLASLKREKSKRWTFICFIGWKIEEIETPNLIPIFKKKKKTLVKIPYYFSFLVITLRYLQICTTFLHLGA